MARREVQPEKSSTAHEGNNSMRQLIRQCLLAAFTASTIILAACLAPVAEACTRAVYFGKDGTTITGRSMDWREDMHSNLWVFPRGLKRDGGMGDLSLKWTSQYGSLIASVYEAATSDGMNEKGLVANLLYLAESEYPALNDTRPSIVISAWAQYVLDKFATVDEAVAELRKESFRMVPTDAPNGAKGTVHLAITDPSGDSAILEYIKGQLVIHHGRQYQVMTNSPIFDEQIALNKYWQQIGGTVMLPGTNRAADRFARASFYINACSQTADAREAVASVFSVMRNVSVPRGISTPDQPNIASTIWRTVSDQKNRVYFFENTASPSLVWVELDKIDFREGSGTRKLTLFGKPDLGGDQSANFEKAEPFKFLAPPTK
jgi:choloylglycine hydrolase